MRRRDGLVEQKAGLVSSNETLEKEIAVSSTIAANSVVIYSPMVGHRTKD